MTIHQRIESTREEIDRTLATLLRAVDTAQSQMMTSRAEVVSRNGTVSVQDPSAHIAMIAHDLSALYAEWRMLEWAAAQRRTA